MSALLLAAEKKFWILDPLYGAFGGALAWFYAVIPSFGLAIILLTVAVSILRMPLVAKQVKSQQEMQRIQPELKRIQAKYKNEPQKRNEELMKLYKEHNVNPLAGCLPLFLQMPLFIVLYRMILGLGKPEPKHIPRSSDLFHALQSAGGKMRSFGMDLAESAANVGGFFKLLPYLLLIGLVIATGVFQQRQMTRRLPKEAQNSQMALMGKIFPAFFGLISWSIPAGVVLYFFVSNMWQIGQQAVLFRRQEAQKAAGDGKAGKGPKVKEVPPADEVAAEDGQAPPAGAGGGRTGGGGTPGGGKAGGARSGKGGPAAKPRSAAGKASGGGKPGTPAKGGAAKTGASQPPQGRGLFGRFAGAGKAGGRTVEKSARKADRRPPAGKDGSSSNGRGSSRGGSGRAQPKGTNPQGRSRKGK